MSRRAPGKNDVDSHIFRSLMAQGKVRSALSYLSREQTGRVLGLDKIIPQSQGLTTRDVLRDKHPPGKPACPESLLPDTSEVINPIIYSNLNVYSMQPCTPRVPLASLASMHMLGEDCALRSSQPLMTCAMHLLPWDGEFVPLTYIVTISVPLLPAD